MFVTAEDDADGVAEAEADAEAAGGVTRAATSPGSAGEPAPAGPSREGAAGLAEPASSSAPPEARSTLLPSPIPTPAPSATHTSSALMISLFPYRRGGSVA